MRAIILATILVGLLGPVSAPVARVGVSLYYSAGVFARVAHNRGMALRTDVDGYAALPSCSHIGKVVTARINGGKLERYQVLDCAQTRDYAALVRRGVVIEIDYASAKRRGFVSKGSAPATVYYP